jgi:hypothetical protein
MGKFRFAVPAGSPGPYVQQCRRNLLQGWNTASVRLTGSIKTSENMRLMPYIGVQIPLEALDDGQNDKFFGGFAVSYSF